MSGTGPLTERQRRYLEKLPQGHTLVRIRDGGPIVRRPDGRLVRIKPSGRQALSSQIEPVQYYLNVHG